MILHEVLIRPIKRYERVPELTPPRGGRFGRYHGMSRRKVRFVAVVPDYPEVKSLGVTKEDAALAAIDEATNILVRKGDIDNPDGPHVFDWKKIEVI